MYIYLVLRKLGGRWIHYDSLKQIMSTQHIAINPVLPLLATQQSATERSADTKVANKDNVKAKPYIRSENAKDSESNVTALSQQRYGTLQTSSETKTSIQQSTHGFKIDTWNVRGANLSDKRNEIDRQLMCDNLGIVALQETKLTSRTCDTRHYKWVLGKDNGSARNARRVAFLVHCSLTDNVLNKNDLTDNIQYMEIKLEHATVMIVNVHMPQDKNDAEFHALRTFLLNHVGSVIIIMGDFNAHIGRLDLTEEDKKVIGPRIHHEYCNDNGKELKNIIHASTLNLHITWSRSPSVLITWKSGNMTSQIDHIMSNCAMRLEQIKRCGMCKEIPRRASNRCNGTLRGVK